MSLMEPLHSLMQISTSHLSKKEIYLLEARLFLCVCHELKEFFRKEHDLYFRLMKYTTEEENAMLEVNFIRFIMRDIISSEEYTLEGIARYTDIPEDIVMEIFTGSNENPSAKLLRRIIELHYSVQPDLYQSILKKAISKQ